MTNLMQSSISSLPSADWQTLGPWQFAVRFDTIMFFSFDQGHCKLVIFSLGLPPQAFESQSEMTGLLRPCERFGRSIDGKRRSRRCVSRVDKMHFDSCFVRGARCSDLGSSSTCSWRAHGTKCLQGFAWRFNVVNMNNIPQFICRQEGVIPPVGSRVFVDLRWASRFETTNQRNPNTRSQCKCLVPYDYLKSFLHKNREGLGSM